MRLILPNTILLIFCIFTELFVCYVMKTVRRILFFISFTALAVLSIGLLLPRKVNVERRIMLKASVHDIFVQVNTLKNWEKWSPWLQLDTNMLLSFSGPASGVGSRYTWFSQDKNIGNGYIFIHSSVPDESVQVLMDFGKNGRSNGEFHFIQVKDSIEVIWNIETDLGMNPLTRWFGLFSDRMVGPDLVKGLLNLEKQVKEIKIVNGFEITDYTVPAQILLSLRDTASQATISSKLSTMYMKVARFMKSGNLTPSAPPLAIFHNCADSIFDIEACIPIDTLTPVKDGLKCTLKESAKTVMIKYFGPYHSIKGAYNALQTCINNRELKVAGPPWEEYVSNPNMESDSGKWQTNIYYPVR